MINALCNNMIQSDETKLHSSEVYTAPRGTQESVQGTEATLTTNCRRLLPAHRVEVGSLRGSFRGGNYCNGAASQRCNSFKWGKGAKSKCKCVCSSRIACQPLMSDCTWSEQKTYKCVSACVNLIYSACADDETETRSV